MWSSFVLKPKPPYVVTRHLELFTLEGLPSPVVYSRGVCRSLAPAGEGYEAVECRISGEPLEPLIECRTTGDIDTVSRIVAERLRIDFDYNRFLDEVRGNDKLYRLAMKYLGLRPTRLLRLYEALIDSVVKQRISLRMAVRIMARLVESYGAHMNVDGVDFYWYPEADTLYNTSVEELRRHSLTRVKARSLKEIAAAEVEGRLPGLREVLADPWGVAGELTRIYGVGKWTAELAVAMVLDDFRLGPTTDLAVVRGLERLGLDSPGPERYRGLVMYLASLEYESGKA